MKADKYDKKLDNINRQLAEIDKKLEGSVDRAEQELKEYHARSELPPPPKPPEHMTQISEKESLMATINEETIRFSRLSQKGVTKEDRDKFIDTQLERIEKLQKMQLSLSDKLLMSGARKALSRMKNLPVKQMKSSSETNEKMIENITIDMTLSRRKRNK